MLKIRAHHLLCLQHFEGKGYSPEFVEHMGAIQKRLAEEPFEWIDHCDDICAHCIHCRGMHCDSKKPAQYDQRIRILYAFPDRPVFMKELRPILFLLDQHLEWICQGCQWMNICKKSVSRND